MFYIIKMLLVYHLVCHEVTANVMYYQHRMNLFNYLFSSTRYNKCLVPVSTPDKALALAVDLQFGDYLEVHETTQTVRIDLWMHLLWKDDLMTWNTSDYGGISRMRIDESQVWHPKLQINFGTEHSNIVDQEAQFFAFENGSIKASVIRHIDFRCSLSVEKFPFDQQECKFHLVVLNAIESEAYFTNASTRVVPVGSGQWEILSHKTHIVEREGISMLDVCFTLKRLPSYYVIYIMIPIIATAELNPVVFLIPPDSGEKFSTAVTILLSYSVLLSVISGVLPNTSTSISILSLYIAGSQLLSGIYVLLCIIIVRRFNNVEICNLYCCASKDDSKGEYRSGTSKAEAEIHQRQAIKLDKICAGLFFTLISVLSVAILTYILI